MKHKLSVVGGENVISSVSQSSAASLPSRRRLGPPSAVPRNSTTKFKTPSAPPLSPTPPPPLHPMISDFGRRRSPPAQCPMSSEVISCSDSCRILSPGPAAASQFFFAPHHILPTSSFSSCSSSSSSSSSWLGCFVLLQSGYPCHSLRGCR